MGDIELRGEECFSFIRLAASGHPGSITSVHAGSCALALEQMSLMIRESSCPDSQALWNCMGSRCSWAKRSSRMSVSMKEVAFTMIHRRRKEMKASVAPTASSASANHSTPSTSPSLMGPSTTPPSSSGMEMLSPTPTGAMANENANCQR